jgi:hypothetical protein
MTLFSMARPVAFRVPRAAALPFPVVHAGELLQYVIPEALSIAVCLSHIYPDLWSKVLRKKFAFLHWRQSSTLFVITTFFNG